MSNELTITSIYTDIGSTYDGLINNLKQTTLMQAQSNLLQCVVCHRLREHINSTSTYGSKEKKDKLNTAVKVLGPDAKLSLFTKYAVVGGKIQSAIDSGVTPEIALNHSMKYYITTMAKPQESKKFTPCKNLDEQLLHPVKVPQCDTRVSKSDNDALQDKYNDLLIKHNKLRYDYADILDGLDALKDWKESLIIAMKTNDSKAFKRLMEE